MPTILRSCARLHTRTPTRTLYRYCIVPRSDRLQDPATAPTGGRARPRTQVRSSSVHGRGVFATRFIPAGDTIFEYVGEVITWDEALRRHPHDPSQPDHTFYFHIDDNHVIDGNVGGNSSRWINHSCDPNCEADETDEGRVFVKALRDLLPGEELCYDYGLIIDERYTAKLKKQFECRCGAAACRGTMLAPKRRSVRAPGRA
jgi:uncharacterized protein